eukprot:SAG11_NODE_4109_length_2061_cov_1.398063_3_plen_179_part_01
MEQVTLLHRGESFFLRGEAVRISALRNGWILGCFAGLLCDSATNLGALAGPQVPDMLAEADVLAVVKDDGNGAGQVVVDDDDDDDEDDYDDDGEEEYAIMLVRDPHRTRLRPACPRLCLPASMLVAMQEFEEQGLQFGVVASNDSMLLPVELLGEGKPACISLHHASHVIWPPCFPSFG